MNRIIATKMTEDELQELVRSMCRKLGLAVQHVHDARRCWLPGWPDLCIFGTRLIFRELKDERNRLSPDQRRVGSLLERAGQDWCVWRPGDWASGVIARQLQEISPGPPGGRATSA